jgi:hypothetical protein
MPLVIGSPSAIKEIKEDPEDEESNIELIFQYYDETLNSFVRTHLSIFNPFLMAQSLYMFRGLFADRSHLRSTPKSFSSK